MKFGTVTYFANKLHGQWNVRCEPHVRARLKRVFPRTPQGAADTLTISATDENSRELLWFLVRYPMDVDRPDLLAAGSQRHIEKEATVASMFADGYVPKPVNLALPPREYQLFAANLLDRVNGLLLADDVGLGKTVTAICSLVQEAYRPALVVCPTHLPRQWQNMIATFAPDLSTYVVTDGKPRAPTYYMRGGVRERAIDATPDVMIINYHKLRTWYDYFGDLMKFVVFDEAQKLRNPESQMYQSAQVIAGKATRVLGLTATPIHNYGSEFFHVLNLIRPGALGQRDEFLREWCNPGFADKARLKDPEEFGTYLRREGLMLRRERKDVGRELPELTTVVHTIDAEERTINDAMTDATKLARVILKANETYKGEKMRAAGEFDALMRQATGVAKAKPVADFVRLLLESEEKVVLVGWHRSVYQIWREALAEFNPVLYTGSESTTQKEDAKRAFIEGKSRVFILSLRSGEGLDGLQGHCNVIVFGELDWSPAVHIQCIGRVHRDGQDKPCVAYFLTAEHGSDPIVIDVLGVKRQQSDGVLNPDRALVERVDIGEDNIKRLARTFLENRGIAVDEVDPPPTVLPIAREIAARSSRDDLRARERGEEF